MMSRDTAAGGWRAITAVIALYAFVLQVFLGTLTPLPALGHATPICSGIVEGIGTAEDPAPSAPTPSAHGAHTLCCTSVTVIAGVDQPALASSEIVWPAPSVFRPAWRHESRLGARGPPGSIPHPRGPPVA